MEGIDADVYVYKGAVLVEAIPQPDFIPVANVVAEAEPLAGARPKVEESKLDFEPTPGEKFKVFMKDNWWLAGVLAMIRGAIT